MRSFKAFTLAEIMVVLVILGVLAGVLLPIANNARPDENVMKFKKANETLSNVVHEMVTSDKYYCNGDLALKAPDCTPVDSNYFCLVMADLLSTKEVHCDNVTLVSTLHTGNDYKDFSCRITRDITSSDSKYNYIITNDGITYIFENAAALWSPTYGRLFPDPNNPNTPSHNKQRDPNGFDWYYPIKVIVSVDGLEMKPIFGKEMQKATETPWFCYAIRLDGKIKTHITVDEWQEKAIQKGGSEDDSEEE